MSTNKNDVRLKEIELEMYKREKNHDILKNVIWLMGMLGIMVLLFASVYVMSTAGEERVTLMIKLIREAAVKSWFEGIIGFLGSGGLIAYQVQCSSLKKQNKILQNLIERVTIKNSDKE